MELIPKIGIGPLRFGMRPSEVKDVLGPEHGYESWMGGNLNDSLLYSGMILGFDRCDSRGPLNDSKLIEFRINQNADIHFLQKPVFKITGNEFCQTLEQHNINIEREPNGYMFLPELNIELEPDENGNIVSLSFWCEPDR